MKYLFKMLLCAKKNKTIFKLVFLIVYITDGSRGYIFTTAIAIVCAVVEFSTTADAVAFFGCLTNTFAVAVVGCEEYET